MKWAEQFLAPPVLLLACDFTGDNFVTCLDAHLPASLIDNHLGKWGVFGYFE
jgi:hypothetical protein